MTNFQCPKCGKEHVSLKQFCEYCGEDFEKYLKFASFSQIAKNQTEITKSRTSLIKSLMSSGALMSRLPFSIQIIIHILCISLIVYYIIFIIALTHST